MKITDELLMAYVDGELDETSREQVEAAVAADPALAEQLARHRRLSARVSGAYGGVADEAVPERLLAAVRNHAPAEVVDLAAIRARKAPPAEAPKRDWRWAAMAACAGLGLVVGLGLPGLEPRPLVGANLSAGGSLSQALDKQLASNQGSAAVRVGLSFKAGESYCRTFQVTKGDPVAGVACREDGSWKVRMAMAQKSAAGGDYRMAASETPPAVMAAVEQMISGEVLDARGEAAAQAKGWKP